MIIFYVPCKDKKEAYNIAKELIKEKLVACANIIPTDSVYEWEGKIVEEKEVILMMKTINKHEEVVKRRTMHLHTYDIPAIVRINTKVNPEYLFWMEKFLK